MDFELGPENKAIRDTVQRFARDEIRPHVNEWERDEIFPRSIYERMGELGFLGATFPEEYGGSALGFLNFAIIAEEISRAHEALGAAFNMNAMTCPFTVLNWGTDAQRQQYIAPWILGQKIGFFGLTEAGGGTDVLGGMHTRAERRDTSYVINGAKQFITLGTVADIGILFCKTDPNAGHRGVSCFIVDTSLPGFSTSLVRTRVLGECWPTSTIQLDDVKLPLANLVGQEGQGFQIAMNALDYGRLTVAARCIGIAHAALDDMVEYAKVRTAFGQPIGRFQQIQAHIANTVVELDAARFLVYRLGWMLDVTGTSQPRLSAQAKYYAAEVAYHAAERAYEVFGGYGVTDEYPAARHLNTAAFLRTGEGSANLLRILIAEDALDYRHANDHQIPQRFPFK
ncbi:MAG TPA: acyl-CoA dehydrogenase family protein [Ktedonobacteraceae bacterium]|nr:acyl-CoA dehydrogenase family protein [Ktedonobacteraceae bacterium]